MANKIKHCYAEFMEDGLDRPCGNDRLMQFMTKEERDEMVEQINNADYCPRARPVTVREASKRYNMRHFWTDECEESTRRTCHGHVFWLIEPMIGR